MGEEDKKKKKSKKEKKSEGESKESTKKAARRTGSNIFAMFPQRQVQEFKEAFQLMDQNKDGFLDKQDLQATFDSLGRVVTSSDLEEMISEAPGPINFTMFLTIFGERIAGTDDEEVIVNAFKMFDEEGQGFIHEDKLRKALVSWGDRFTDDEVDDAFQEAPRSREGIDYTKYSNLITKGAEEDEEA